MYYKKREQSDKVKKRILRRNRTRYHNDAALFKEEAYSAPRKRTKALLRRSADEHIEKYEDIDTWLR